MAKLEFDEGLVRRLSDLLEETGLTEIEYETGGQRIRVVRNHQAAFVPAPAVAPAAAPGGETAEAPAIGEAESANAVAAPMVGTVYLAPEPGGAAFVNVGDQVQQGETLVIIRIIVFEQVHQYVENIFFHD